MKETMTFQALFSQYSPGISTVGYSIKHERPSNLETVLYANSEKGMEESQLVLFADIEGHNSLNYTFLVETNTKYTILL